jgi:hypothetical protein
MFSTEKVTRKALSAKQLVRGRRPKSSVGERHRTRYLFMLSRISAFRNQEGGHCRLPSPVAGRGFQRPRVRSSGAALMPWTRRLRPPRELECTGARSGGASLWDGNVRRRILGHVNGLALPVRREVKGSTRRSGNKDVPPVPGSGHRNGSERLRLGRPCAASRQRHSIYGRRRRGFAVLENLPLKSSATMTRARRKSLTNVSVALVGAALPWLSS